MQLGPHLHRRMTLHQMKTFQSLLTEWDDRYQWAHFAINGMYKLMHYNWYIHPTHRSQVAMDYIHCMQILQDLSYLRDLNGVVQWIQYILSDSKRTSWLTHLNRIEKSDPTAAVVMSPFSR